MDSVEFEMTPCQCTDLERLEEVGVYACKDCGQWRDEECHDD